MQALDQEFGLARSVIAATIRNIDATFNALGRKRAPNPRPPIFSDGCAMTDSESTLPISNIKHFTVPAFFGPPTLGLLRRSRLRVVGKLIRCSKADALAAKHRLRSLAALQIAGGGEGRQGANEAPEKHPY